MSSVVIATIIKPHGLWGELKVRPYLESLSGLLGRDVRLGGLEDVYAVSSLRAGDTLMRLVGINDFDSAESLRGRDLCLDAPTARKLLSKGERLCEDLLQRGVRDALSLRRLGTVKDILFAPQAAILVIELEAEHASKRISVPYLERFFPEPSPALTSEELLLQDWQPFLEI